MTRKLVAVATAALLAGVLLVTRPWKTSSPSSSAHQVHTTRPPLTQRSTPPAQLPEQREAAVRRGAIDELAATQGIEGLKKAWAQSSDAADREQMLIAAAKLGHADAVVWIAEIASTDPKLGARAGAALGSVASPAAADELVRLASTKGEVIVRANAARALARSGSTTHASTLTKLAVADDQPQRVRQEAALAIGQIGDREQARAIAAALLAQADRGGVEAEQLRISLIQALGRLGGVPAIGALETHAKRQLSTNEQTFVRHALKAARSAS